MILGKNLFVWHQFILRACLAALILAAPGVLRLTGDVDLLGAARRLASSAASTGASGTLAWLALALSLALTLALTQALTLTQALGLTLTGSLPLALALTLRLLSLALTLGLPSLPLTRRSLVFQRLFSVLQRIDRRVYVSLELVLAVDRLGLLSRTLERLLRCRCISSLQRLRRLA